MILAALDPDWVADYEPADHSHRRGGALTIDTAQGVLFECPKCRQHSILVWFAGRGVPDDAEPGAAYAPGKNENYPEGRRAQRWAVSGTGFSDLTLKPSIDTSKSGGCAWHGFVTAGDAS